MKNKNGVVTDSYGQVKIKAESLTPMQHYSSAKEIQRSADCYLQRFIKFPFIGIFHSYAEFLHAALLEADSNVTSFVPQPLNLLVQNRRYIPDCYYLHKSSRYVAEIKPEGEFEDKLRLPLKAFLKPHGIKFEVISNESILEKERLALNWLQIIRTLISSELLSTEYEELKLTERISIGGELELGSIISIGNRLKDNKNEIAVYRLAHKGIVQLMNIEQENINYSTGVSLCT